MSTAAKIVAINGSERDGNTADVLPYAAAVAEQHGAAFETVDLRNLRNLCNLRMLRCGPCGDCNDRLIRCRADRRHPRRGGQR